LANADVIALTTSILVNYKLIVKLIKMNFALFPQEGKILGRFGDKITILFLNCFVYFKSYFNIIMWTELEALMLCCLMKI
jgi:hypothetical protein